MQADHLQWTDVPITSNKMCQDEYPIEPLDPEVMICAGGNVRTFKILMQRSCLPK